MGHYRKQSYKSNPKIPYSQLNFSSLHEHFTCTIGTRIGSQHFSALAAKVAKEMEGTQGKNQSHDRHRTEWKSTRRSLQLKQKRSEADRSKRRGERNAYIQLQDPSTYSEATQHATDIVQHKKTQDIEERSIQRLLAMIYFYFQ